MTTIKMPGPFTIEYTLINQQLPPQPHAMKQKEGTGKFACTIARMEFFHDKRAREALIIGTWARLRLIDPTLKPWALGQTIASTNPLVLNKFHPLHTACHGAFWADGYFTSTVTHRTRERFMRWRRQHGLDEHHEYSKLQLLMQLACSFFSYEDWVHIVANRTDVKDVGMDAAEGSHACGNGSFGS